MVKNSLWDDALFEHLVAALGADDLYDVVADFREDLTLQLKNREEAPDDWKRRVVALIIRAKKRMRELEKME